MKYNTHSFHSTCSPSCRDSPADAVKSGTKHGQPITSPRGLFSRHRGRGPLRGVARRRFIRTATGFLPLSRASHPPQRPRPCSPRRLPPRVRKGLVSVTTGHARGESVRRCHVCARSVHCRSAINGSSQPARTRATPHLSITISIDALAGASQPPPPPPTARIRTSCRPAPHPETFGSDDFVHRRRRASARRRRTRACCTRPSWRCSRSHGCRHGCRGGQGNR